MKTRRVFRTNDLQTASAAIKAARSAGMPDDDISLVARADIEMEQIPDHRLNEHHDSQPAAIRGAALGGGSGLLLGLIAVVVPPLGLTLAGAGALALIGAAVGAGSGALVGLDVPDAVSREYAQEIKAGHILVVLDAEPELLELAQAAILPTGAIALSFESMTTMS